MNDVYLYRHSLDTARDRDSARYGKAFRQFEIEPGSLEAYRWWVSHGANLSCVREIEYAMRSGYDGERLKDSCAQNIIDEFGYKRVNWVLAATLQHAGADARISDVNREWAMRTQIPKESFSTDYDPSERLHISAPLEAIDQFADQYRLAYQKLGLFDRAHCEADSGVLDYTGKVLVLSTDILKESCWRQEDQLWYAYDGFGCRPNARGRSIHCECLGDGEKTRWNRADFAGVLKDEHLPEWAREKLARLTAPRQEQSSQMGGMSMT